jgi:hypothetical protein
MKLKELVLTKNYYSLIRFKKKKDILEILQHDSSLTELAAASVVKLNDKIYGFLVSNKKPKNFGNLDLNNKSIDDKISELLAFKSQLFESIEENEIKNSLFTEAAEGFYKKFFLKDGQNKERYIIQDYVSAWLQELIAKEITKDSRFKSSKLISGILEESELNNEFYGALIKHFPEDWVKKLKNFFLAKPESIKSTLEYPSPFDKGYYESRTKDSKFSELEAVDNAFRNAQYALLNREFNFRNQVLFYNNYSLWVTFWDKINDPLLQIALLDHISLPKHFNQIAFSLNRRKEFVTPPKRLSLIILNQFFKKSENIRRRLYFYKDENIKSLNRSGYDQEIIKLGQSTLKKWNNFAKKSYDKLFHKLKDRIGEDELSEWVFSYQYLERSNPEGNNSHNEEVDSLMNAFKSYVNTLSLSSYMELLKLLEDNFNLQKFIYLTSELAKNKDIKEFELTHLKSLFLDYVKSEDFRWSGNLNEPYWSALKSLAYILSKFNYPINEAKKLAKDFKVSFEGWGIQDLSFEAKQRETFIYCGIIFLFEHEINENKGKEFYKEFLDQIVNQSRFLPYKNRDYFLPLYLLLIVSEKIRPNFQSLYEERVIKSIDELSVVVKLLSKKEVELQNASKKMIKNRLDNEFYFVRRIFAQKGMNEELKGLEEEVKKLNVQDISS